MRMVVYVVLAFRVGTMYFEKGKHAREDDTIVGQKAAESLLPLLFLRPGPVATSSGGGPLVRRRIAVLVTNGCLPHSAGQFLRHFL